MWHKIQILLLYCMASEVSMAKHLDSKRNLPQGLYSVEDSGSAKWNRIKRSLYQGRSCRIRGCCTGRDDDCSFAIVSRAAVCYCDQYCTSGSPGPVDCCADYWDVCNHPVQPTRSEEPWPPPAWGCYKDGRYYGEGTIIKDNCNSCKCFNSLWKCSTDVCLVRQDLIQRINSGDYGWKADNYSQFWGMTVEEGFKKRLGTFPPSHSLLNMREAPGMSLPEEKFPAIFSATYEWPEWIHDPLDQRNCGASWAFSTASVAADRIAIQSKGQITDNLSAQNLISCDTRNQHGCNGGSIDGAWRYLKTHGVVSYACYPSFWNKHLGPAAENQCYVSSEYGKNHTNGPCPNTFERSNRLYRCASHYRVSSKETDIMKEIMDRGPVQAIMKVYEDFFLYKEGIYQHSQKAGSKWKTHSVKLLGWGALRGKNGQKQKFWGTRSQTPGWSHSTWHQTPQEKLRRMDHNVGQVLRSDQDVPAPGRSERRHRARRVSFTEPQTARSRSPQRSCSVWHQTLRERLRRMERDEGRALRPERDIPSSSGWSERHERGRRVSFTDS